MQERQLIEDAKQKNKQVSAQSQKINDLFCMAGDGNKCWSSECQIDYIFTEYKQPSMFEAILEECSSRQIEIEQFNGQYHQNQLLGPQIIQEHTPGSSNIWFLMDEVPFDNILDQHQQQTEDATLEEQQTKIAQFLRDDKYKSLRNIEMPVKDTSPLGKASQSLSPRKTKKIDKPKSLKIFPQSD